MKLEEAVAMIEEIVSPDTQENWDNTGIQAAAGSGEVSKVLTCLEITGEVIEEAKEKGADFIVTHHPLIFGGLRSVDFRETTGSYLIELIRAGISVYSCHTPFDKMDGGNNDFIANLLELQDVQGFFHEGAENKIGRTGYLKEEASLDSVRRLLSQKLELDSGQIRMVGDPEMKISKVGICTGAGADLLPLAAENGCSLFITGDLKYHDAQKAKALGLAVLDAGHYGTEKSFGANFAMKLKEKAGDKLEVFQSQVDINPFEMI